MTLRRLASKLHLYVGLLTMIVLLPIGLTGSILVFHEELEAALYPELVRVEPAGARVAVDSVVAVVEAAFPEERIARMELPQAAPDTYEVILRDDRQVYVDPYRGVVLGVHRPEETLPGWLFHLHVNLLAGERGKTVVGVVGLLLVLMALTGVVLWWRGRRNVRRGLTVKWQASGQRVNYDVHNTVGFYLLVPLLVVAFTGAGLVFFGAFATAAHRLTGTPQPPPAPTVEPPPGARLASIDGMLARAQAALPEGTLARIDFPATPEAALRVRLRMPEELHPIGLSMVFLDPYTGEVLHAESALEVPVARRFGYSFYPLHIGSFGGFGVRIVYVLIGLAPVVLGITGFIIWYGRRRKKRRRAASPQRQAVPVRLNEPV